MPYQKTISKEKTIKIDNDAKIIASSAKRNGQNLTLEQLFSINRDVRNQKSLNIWKDLAFDRDFATFKVLNPSKNGPQISFSRGTGATQIGSTGLVEFGPENLFTQSETFSTWNTTTSSTITPNTIASPVAGKLASTITSTTTGQSRIELGASQIGGTTYTISCYLKRGSSRYGWMGIYESTVAPATSTEVIFDLQNGVITSFGGAGLVSYSIESVGNGWYRCIYTKTLTSGNFSGSGWKIGLCSSPTISYVSNVGDTIYAWGAQLERGLSAKTYLPVTSAAYYGPRFTHKSTITNNFLTWSEELGNAVWFKNNIIHQSNVEIAPDGNFTADLISNTPSVNSYFYQNIASQPPGTYTLSFYAKANSAECKIYIENFSNNSAAHYFDIAAGTIVGSGTSFTMTNVGNGWYRCSTTKAFASNLTFAGVIYIGAYGNTVVNNSVFIWGFQVEASTSPSPYIKTESTIKTVTNIESLGLLVEESRTNILHRSEEFDNSTWGKSSFVVSVPTVTANSVIAPNGLMTADTISLPAVSGVNSYSFLFQTITPSVGNHTYSVWLRGNSGGETVWIIAQGTGYARTAATLTTSWQRFTLTFTRTSSVMYALIGIDLRDTQQSAKSAQTIYAWGAQIEAGDFATSYIPTTNAGVTRAADVATVTSTNFSSWFNPSQGTFVVNKVQGGLESTQNGYGRVIGISSGNRTVLAREGGSNIGSWDGVTSFNVGLSYDMATAPVSAAMTYNGNTLSRTLSANGGNVSTSSYVANSFDTGIGIGTNLTVSTNMLNGTIGRIRYYGKAFSNVIVRILSSL